MSYSSKLMDCPICFGKFHARGLLGHLRLLHGIVLKNISQVCNLVRSVSSQSDLSLLSHSSHIEKNDSRRVYIDMQKARSLVGSNTITIAPVTALISKAVEKANWGTYPSGTDKCLGCDKYFWENEMVKGFFAPQVLYCKDCYQRMLDSGKNHF